MNDDKINELIEKVDKLDIDILFKKSELIVEHLNPLKKRVEQIVKTMYELEIISFSKAAEILGLNTEKMRELGLEWRDE